SKKCVRICDDGGFGAVADEDEDYRHDRMLHEEEMNRGINVANKPLIHKVLSRNQ
ncbi:hypothetical protein RYX36_000154, partial [Vicia faba]